jgi:quercetin dioxygenase-like cupin family protein
MAYAPARANVDRHFRLWRWAQREGGPIEEIRPGDVVWFSPGERHWHGATPTTAMTHIAIQESLNGKVVDWMEHVTEQQYRK